MLSIIRRLFLYGNLLLLTAFLLSGSISFAQTPTDTPTPTSSSGPTPTPDNSGQIKDLQNKINDLQDKITDLQGEKKTLSSQIAVMDTQIELTELKIASTKQQLSELESDIEKANKKIGNLEEALDNLTKILLKRIVATYQTGNTPMLNVLLSSGSVSDFLTKSSYLKLMQEHDRRLIYDTQQARNDYQNQKNIFEDKKAKVVALKTQLEDYNEQLEQEKKGKQALLEATKNSEAIYQQKLAAALAEYQAIQKISAGLANAVSVGDVKQGDVVGHVIVGRSACSSGSHLHFEVSKEGSTQDPASYLSGKSVIFDNSPDGQFGFGGSWPWPLSDPVRITQGYGMTYWARTGWYGGGPHTGIDMYSDGSLSVFAVKDGKLYRGSIACGGGQLQFARVDHDDGVQTYYLHISP